MTQTVYRQQVHGPARGAADILLIRHGESQAAEPGRPFPLRDGQGDPALHEAGQAQARAIAARLGGEKFDALYVSSLTRTHQTAAPLAARLGMTPVVEPDLREVHLGDWDRGEYRIHAAQGHPAIARMRAQHEWGALPNAETSAALMARVEAALTRIAALHADQRIAVFVHGGVIGAAMAVATGARPLAFATANNGSISRLAIGPGGWMVLGFNDCTHLGGTVSPA